MKQHLLAGTSLLALIAATPSAWATTCTSTFLYTGAVEDCTVPATAGYQIIAYGAQGGNAATFVGGKGAEIGGDFVLTAGEKLQIAVGEVGGDQDTGGGGGGRDGGGGGGNRNRW